jgi:hypothetical protein
MEKSEVLRELSIEHEVEEVPIDDSKDYGFAFQFSFDSDNGEFWEEWLFDVSVVYRSKLDILELTAVIPEGAAKNLELISEGTSVSNRGGKTLLCRVINQISAKQSVMDEVNKLIDDAEEFISPQ